MVLSFQMGFSLVRAAVVCAILERTSCLDPLSDTIAPRYLKLSTLLMALDFDVRFDVIGVVGHHFGLLCTYFHSKGSGGGVQPLN